MSSQSQLRPANSETKFVVRVLGHLYAICCQTKILERMQPKDLFQLVLEDTQQNSLPRRHQKIGSHLAKPTDPTASEA